MGTRRVAGRSATGVATTAAQVAPMLAGLAPPGAGNLRSLHPSDRAELWLDTQRLVPLALRVTAAPTDERRAWADANGYRDRPGQVVLELTLARVSLDRPLEADAFPPPPAGPGPRTRGSATAGAGGGAGRVRRPAPVWLPAGFRAHRAGVAGEAPGPTVAVRTWTDGRAWVKVRATRTWAGGRLFGDLGELVHPVALGAGVVYRSEDGTRVAVHGQGLDLLVTGSVSEADLARVATSCRSPDARCRPDGPRRRPRPCPRPPRPTRVCAGPATARLRPAGRRVDGRTVTLAYAGPGSRRVPAVCRPTVTLARRWTAPRPGVGSGRGTALEPGRGELEWVEQGRTTACAAPPSPSGSSWPSPTPWSQMRLGRWLRRPGPPWSDWPWVPGSPLRSRGRPTHGPSSAPDATVTPRPTGTAAPTTAADGCCWV